MTLRFFIGFGDACTQNASILYFAKMHIVFSSVAYEFPEHRDLVFGILEAAFGVGFTFGPLIG